MLTKDNPIYKVALRLINAVQLGDEFNITELLVDSLDLEIEKQKILQKENLISQGIASAHIATLKDILRG